MTIRDGESDNEPREIKATVDPMAVAQLVHQLQKQNQAAEPKESRFQQRVNKLLASGTVDKDNLTEITELQQAAIADLRDELKGNSANAQSQNQRYAEATTDALEKYIEGDDALEEVADHLQTQILKKLGKDPDVMAKFNAGQLDKRQINAVAKEVVEDFSKKVLKRDKPKSGPTINSTVSGTVSSKGIESSGATGNIDDITEPHRRESYHKLNALFQRNKLSKEDAHNKAYAAATRQYKKAGSSA